MGISKEMSCKLCLEDVHEWGKEEKTEGLRDRRGEKWNVWEMERGGAGLQPGQFGAMRASWKEVAF